MQSKWNDWIAVQTANVFSYWMFLNLAISTAKFPAKKPKITWALWRAEWKPVGAPRSFWLCFTRSSSKSKLICSWWGCTSTSRDTRSSCRMTSCACWTFLVELYSVQNFFIWFSESEANYDANIICKHYTMQMSNKLLPITLKRDWVDCERLPWNGVQSKKKFLTI